MVIMKTKGWYTVSLAEQEDVSFHESSIREIEEALKIIRALAETWGFADYTLEK